MNEKKHRILFIDYFKGLLMILVVAGHINFANSGIKAWIYSFHMPAFFFATGMLLNLSSPQKIMGLFRKYLNRLVIPYFLWALVFAKLTIPNLSLIFYGSYRTIAKAGALSSLWFLPVMFVALMILFVIQILLKEKMTVWIKVLLSIIVFVVGFFVPQIHNGYPWSVNVAFVALGFILLGNVTRPYIFELYHRLFIKKKWWLICLVLFVLCSYGTIVFKYNIPEQGFVLMGNAGYGNFLIFLMSSVLGIVVLLLFAIFIELFFKGKNVFFLSFIGQNTLCIFAVQKPIIQVFRHLFFSVQVPDILVLVIVTMGTLLVSCIMCLFVNKYMPVFVGK